SRSHAQTGDHLHPAYQRPGPATPKTPGPIRSRTISRQQQSDNRSSRSHHQPLATSLITTTRKQAINLKLEFVHSLVRIIHATVKVHIQDNPALIVGVLVYELLRVTVRLDLFSAPQLDKFGAILANRCPTTRSRQGALRVIVMRLPEIHRRNKTAITIRRILHNALKLLIKRVLRHGRTTHVSPRRSINELAQARSRRRRILRLRVPAGLPSNNVIESLPPGTALNRPPLSLSPRLTAFSPDTSRYNVFNV